MVSETAIYPARINLGVEKVSNSIGIQQDPLLYSQRSYHWEVNADFPILILERKLNL